MAISLVSKNVSEYVKLISVNDSAIDWDASYPDVEVGEDDTELLEAKQKYHIDSKDYLKLVYKENDEPTIFIFKNPKTLENNKLISNIQLGVAGIGKKKSEAADLWFQTFDALCIGTASNMLDEPTYIPRDKNTKQIDKGVMQALSSQGVISEMAGILLSISNDKGTSKKS